VYAPSAMTKRANRLLLGLRDSTGASI
jgi:hypothetical protein